MTSREWRVFVLLALMWGSMYIAIKKALPAFSAAELVAWRYLFAGLLLAPFAWRRRANADLAGGIAKTWPLLLLIGIVGSFAPVLFTTLAQRTQPSAMAGMFAALTPIITALFAWALKFDFQQLIAAQPIWLQFVEILLTVDFVTYWVHRGFHQIPLLWNFHAIHHSSEHMDWLAGSRLRAGPAAKRRGHPRLRSAHPAGEIPLLPADDRDAGRPHRHDLSHRWRRQFGIRAAHHRGGRNPRLQLSSSAPLAPRTA